MDTRNAGIQTCCAAADHGGVQRLFQSQVYTVKGGFGNAHQAGNAGGKTELLHIFVFRFDSYHQSRGALGDIGRQHAGTQDSAVAKCCILDRLDRRKAVVHARHNKERAESTH